MKPTLALVNGTDDDHLMLSSYPGPLRCIDSRATRRTRLHLAAIATLNPPYIVLEYGHDPTFDWEAIINALTAIERVAPKPDLLFLNGADDTIRRTIPALNDAFIWREVTTAEYGAHWSSCSAYCVSSAERHRSLINNLTRAPSLMPALSATITPTRTYGAIIPLFERTSK